MVTLAVDDMLLIARQIRDMMREIDNEGQHHAVSDPAEVFYYAENLHPDVVWLDVEMPEISGMEMAARIKELSPDTNIVFVTGYSDYAVEAFSLHASGYVLKPVTEDKLRYEITNLRRPVSELASDHQGTESEKLLRVQCFGNFEVFSNKGMVRFSRSLSKEAFAYLIDRRGAGCTVGEICSVLWEDRAADKKIKSQCRVIMSSLKRDLTEVGAGDVLIKNWNIWGVETAKISCDYYDYLKRDRGAAKSFNGEYMSQYSWAELTAGRLFDIAEADKAR